MKIKNGISALLQMRESRLKGILAALAGAVLVSFDSIYIRMSGTGGVNTVFLFGLFAMISMFSFVHATDDRGLPGTLHDGGWPLLLSGLLMLGSASTFILSVKHTAVANTVIIMGCRPIFTAFFAWLILRERITRTLAVAILAVLFGVGIVVSGSLQSTHLLGDFLALLTVTFLGINGAVQRKYKKMSRMAVVGMAGFFMAAVMFYFADITNFSPKTWLVMGLMGLTTAPFGRVLNAVSNRYLLAAEAAMFTLSISVFATVWAFLVFAEVPAVTTMIGGAVILGTIILYILISSKKKRQQAQVQNGVTAVASGKA